MPVLVRLGDEVGADVAARAGLVLDHHGLTDGILKLRTDQSGKNIARPTWCERHDDPDRLGEILRRGGDWHEAEGQSRDTRKPTDHAIAEHVFLPVSLRTQKLRVHFS